MFSFWGIWRRFPIPSRPEHTYLVRRGVMFRRIRSRVKHVETSIGRGRQLEIVGGILESREIGDQRFRSIVRRTAFFGKMQLPQIFEVRRRLDDVPGGRSSALFCAV